jgi:hypothetical protein
MKKKVGLTVAIVVLVAFTVLVTWTSPGIVIVSADEVSFGDTLA